MLGLQSVSAQFASAQFASAASASMFQMQDSASPATAGSLASKASFSMGAASESDLSMWVGDRDLLTGEYGIDPDLLGEDILANLTFSSGQRSGEEAGFEYWVESLNL